MDQKCAKNFGAAIFPRQDNRLTRFQIELVVAIENAILLI